MPRRKFTPELLLIICAPIVAGIILLGPLRGPAMHRAMIRFEVTTNSAEAYSTMEATRGFLQSTAALGNAIAGLRFSSETSNYFGIGDGGGISKRLRNATTIEQYRSTSLMTLRVETPNGADSRAIAERLIESLRKSKRGNTNFALNIIDIQ